MNDAVPNLDSECSEGLGARCGSDRTSADIEHALVQGALHLFSNEVTIRKGGPTVRAFVLRRVDAAFHTKERNSSTVELTASGFAFRQVGEQELGNEALGHRLVDLQRLAGSASVWAICLDI